MECETDGASWYRESKVGYERAQECARRYERKKCEIVCARQMMRDGTRRVRQPAGGSRGCYTLRAAPRGYTMLAKRKKRKERKDVH
jgi:hypothetical protein